MEPDVHGFWVRMILHHVDVQTEDIARLQISLMATPTDIVENTAYSDSA